jgi:hypothetical protein
MRVERRMQDAGCGMQRLYPCPLPAASCILVLFCMGAVSCPSLGTEPVVVSVDAALGQAKLVGFRADGQIDFLGKTRFTVPTKELVRWGHPALPRPQTLVLLADGSRLVAAADWSGGPAVRLEGDSILVRTVAWSNAKLARDLVSGIVFALHQRWEDRQRLAELVREQRSKKDVLLLSNQDRVSGRLVKLTGGSLTIEVDGQVTKLPLSRVAAVVLAGSDVPSPAPSRRGRGILAIGMRDGSLLNAARVGGAANDLSLELVGGGRLTGGNIDDIAALQGLGGERFVYLSDLEPVDYKHVPYLSIDWPYRRDRSVSDASLMVDGKQYLKGLGMHSASRLTYRLDGKFKRFEATAAIDDSAGGRGSVTFGVYLLHNGQWKQASVSDVLRGGDPPEPVSVDVRGVEMITLTIDFADRGDELDHADWLDARLVKN